MVVDPTGAERPVRIRGREEYPLLFNDLRENVVAGLPIDDMREVRFEGRPELWVRLGGSEPGLDVGAALVLRLPERLVEGPQFDWYSR
jgi:hypothetical protein